MLKKEFRFLTLFSGLLLLSLVLIACQPAETPPDQELVETYAAQTAAALQTEQAEEDIPTDTPTPTETPELVETEDPHPTPTEEPDEDEEETFDQAAFIADITIEDRTILREGETFTKVWRLENIGTSTWTTDFQVVFSSGSQLSAPASSRLPQLVQPGETVDISVNMVAPSTPGTYTGYWLLMNDRGQPFGLGDDADAPFWVRIRVLEEDEMVVYNFAENYCEAGWESSVVDNIACPSEQNLDDGFVQFIEQPQLENGVVYDEPTILTYPDHGFSGYMVGRYPTIEIQDGYHFRATIGCQFGAENCDVRYTLRVFEPSFGHTTLGQWREIYDGLYYPIDVDLSDFAGMEVSIVLSVIAQDDSRENFALWLDPRIVLDGQVPQTGPSPVDVEGEEYVQLYNLADNYCFAGWESSVVDPIACPSSEDLNVGFVQFVDQPRLEDGRVYQYPAILTYPDHGRSGYMVGRFPAMTIQEGDLFRATLGCQFGAGACDVRYTLRVVLPPGGGFETLGQWRITYSGGVYHAEVDLSDYAGEQVDLVLSVIAQDNSRENYAIWVNPRVVRELDPTPTPEEPDDEEICNQAAFIADITIPDRTVLREGATFTKVWRLENIGSCAWTTDYQVVFSSGSQMGAPTASRLPHTVQPGETVDISMDMVTPNTAGTYTGYWLLLDDEGQVFGLGDDADAPFWVRIRVLEDDEMVVYNFAENYCAAGWESSVVDNIACPSEQNLDDGYVQFIEQPQLEDGVIYDEPTILTYPDHGLSGYMVGRFPTIEIQDGYHFRATIGCQFGAEDCDVRYTLRVFEPGFGHTTLGQWREIYDGLYYPIDVDLSEFAGMEVSIVLSVIAQDNARENFALWLDPRIVLDGQVPQPGPSPIDMEEEEYVELYNLADNYCFAGWESSVVDPIACPSSENLDDGFVQFVDNPRLEDGRNYRASAILTYPDHGRSGYLVGRFPSLRIQEGDLFRATLGCRFGAGACDVRYTLRVVLPPGGGFETLAQWRITYTGSVYHAEVDLSDYAGEQVDLVLSVIAQDDSRENHAIWVNPRVIREVEN